MNSFQKIPKNVFILIIIFTLAVGLFSTNLVSAQSFNSNSNSDFNFYRDLKIGDEGQDVLELQKILNQDSETVVAISSVGSLGNETTYFGQLTKNALIKFQNKYSDKVLTPVGLSLGTGYFGPSTISFIGNDFNVSSVSNNLSDNQNEQVIQTSKSFEELLAEIVASRENAEQKSDSVQTYKPDDSITEQINNSNTETNSNSNSNSKSDSESENSNLTTDQSKLIRSDLMEAYYVSQMVFEPGTELTVVGTGINKGSEIYFFNFENDKVVSSLKIESNFIFFDAPNLPEGIYELYIKNGNLISKPLVVEIVEDYNPPKISSVSPSSISYGDTVTIKGSNFESQNTVVTALGTYQISSNVDRSEIKFMVQRFSNLPTNGEMVSPKEKKIEGIIQVQNSNGISDAKFIDFIYN